MATKSVGEMTVEELSAHIQEREESHRREMKHLRALARVLADQATSTKK